MKKLGILLGLFIGVSAFAQDKELKGVVVSGGCCHDYNNQKDILAKGIADRAKITFDIIGNDPKAVTEALSKKGWADKYDVIVYNFCDAHITDADHVKSVVDVHKEGGKAAVMVHCAMHSYHWKLGKGKQDYASKEWCKLVGVGSPGHGPKAKINVTVTEAGKKHPIMQGIPETWTTPQGELYFSKKIFDSCTVLAQGNNGKSDDAVIWANEYGKGKIFSISMGHHNETMEADPYMDVVTRGLLWACGQLK